MKKPMIFISHITEESELALKFKELIQKSYLGIFDVFVSSDIESISLGSKWLNSIEVALENCSVILILCSKESVKKPWINFEAGYGWARKIPVIPICHSGIKYEDLTVPINERQAIMASDEESLNKLLSKISSMLKIDKPKIEFKSFIADVKIIEEKYSLWNPINENFIELNNIYNGISENLTNIKTFKMFCTKEQIEKIDGIMESFFIKNKILSFSKNLTSYKLIDNTPHYVVSIRPEEYFDVIISNPNFIYFT